MNKLFTKLFLSLSASFMMFNVGAQETPHKCGTDHELQKLIKEKPELRKKLEKSFYDNQAQLKSYDDSTVYIIPVVFHVLHQNGPERISLNQIQSCLDALNDNYRNTNSSHANSYYTFDSLRGDAKIEFRLAQIDPYGNCTNGVDYIYTSETMIGDNDSKLGQWDRTKYLNIWTVNSFKRGGGLLGFSMFPEAVADGSFYMDGVMVLYSEVNTYSTTITHEVGHFLNLAHPWGFDNDPEVACGDDGVTDTPITKGYQSICPAPSVNSSRTCTTVDHTVTMNFDSVKVDSGKSDETIYDVNEELYISNFEYVGNASNSTLDSSFTFTDWSTGGVDSDNSYSNQGGSIDVNNYYETRISVTGNNLLNINKISLLVSRSEDGPRSLSVRTSADNFASNVTMVSLNTSIANSQNDNSMFLNDVTTPVLVEATFSSNSFRDFTDQDTISIRVYAWNSENISGEFGIDSVTLKTKTGVIENIENYMDYANCPKMFTKEQIVRMRTALASSTSGRNNLFSESNLAATGVSDDYVSVLCSPKSDFYTDSKAVCTDKNVTFYQAAWGGDVSTYSWEFEDATPATSTSQNPTVKFNSYGEKSVKLIVTNASGSDTITKMIKVVGNWADFVGPKSIDFEDDHKYYFIPVNANENETQFQLAYGKGYGNSDCYVLQNYKDVSMAPAYSSDYFYNARLGSDVDYLYSPSFDLRHTTGVKLKFKYAYATNGTVLTSNASQNADITEKMRIYAVRDCDLSIPSSNSAKKTISGAELLSAGYSSFLNFIPSSNNNWKEFTMNYTASSSLDGNTRFVIAFESSDVSNNLYIDDFMIEGVLGLQQEEISAMNLNVYPNPLNSNQSINVSYIAGNSPVELTLRNAQGQIIYNTTVKTTNAQVNHTLEMDSKLPAACYFLEVQNGEFKTVRKVVVM